MVQGPPGTGKTFTLAKTVQQLVAQQQYNIVCIAKTHRAVDEISNKLNTLDVTHTIQGQDNAPGVPHCCTINSYIMSMDLLNNRTILLIDEVSQLTLPFIFSQCAGDKPFGYSVTKNNCIR